MSGIPKPKSSVRPQAPNGVRVTPMRVTASSTSMQASSSQRLHSLPQCTQTIPTDHHHEHSMEQNADAHASVVCQSDQPSGSNESSSQQPGHYLVNKSTPSIGFDPKTMKILWHWGCMTCRVCSEMMVTTLMYRSTVSQSLRLVHVCVDTR